jgi:uncharacterized protein (DUF2141 family)
MKTILFLLAILTLNQASAQTEETGSIKVQVPNVSSSTGEVLFGLYTEDNFMKEPVVGLKSEIKDGVATVQFENVEKGTYAILVMHDKNLNQKMDFDTSGHPVEDYGSSNNVHAMGPPTWESTKFEYSGKDSELEIRF